MIAGRLTMRAVMQRNQATGTDPRSHPVAPVWVANGTLRCFVWSNSSREIVDGNKTAMVEDMRALFALGADITEGDRITAVTDTTGIVLVPGPLLVDGPVQRKHSHLEAALRRVA